MRRCNAVVVRASALVTVAALIAFGVILGLASEGFSPSLAQGTTNRAALVIRYGNGQVTTRCIQFSEPSITGEKLLSRSGLSVVVDSSSGLGGAVCSINNSGCSFPSQPCFCQCQGAGCQYWAYYHWENGAWQYSNVGGGSYEVTDGDLEGWSWGEGNFSSGVAPPQIGFQQICTSAGNTNNDQNTDQPSTPSAPEGIFEADSYAVQSGACVVLKWAVFNASTASLNGAAVMAQDRQEVCPTSTQRYVLTASNAAGMLTRELTISVAQAAGVPPNALTPTAVVVGPSAPAGLATVAGQSISSQPPVQPQVAAAALTLTPIAPPSPTVSLAVLAATEAPSGPRPTATADRLRVLLAALPTPVLMKTAAPRQDTGAAGRPTPTPMLLAKAQAAAVGFGTSSEQTKAEGGSALDPAQDRTFRPALLLGYGLFLMMAALLLIAAAWTARRHQSRT